MTVKPLSGIRVLDFTAMPPGGHCTVTLADLGAEIIRIESPSQKGKPSLVVRQIALSRGKRSLTLDMRNPAANDILKRLAATVDVVVENAKPGSMEARGFGYKQAREINPKIVWCAITGFGQNGPYADYAGHDISYLAHSGVLGALSADVPWHPGLPLALQAGAQSAVIGIQAALIQAMRSGAGAFIDISLSEAATAMLNCGINPLSDKPLILPATPDRRLYLCADGRYVAVACAEPRTWQALCDHLYLPELKEHLYQAAHYQADTAILADIFKTKPAMEWMTLLAPTGAAVTIMNHAAQLLDDPHVQARGSVVDCAGTPVPANPVRLTAADGSVSGTATEAPHTVGQDTADVLASAGFGAEEIAALTDAGVV